MVEATLKTKLHSRYIAAFQEVLGRYLNSHSVPLEFVEDGLGLGA